MATKPPPKNIAGVLNALSGAAVNAKNAFKAEALHRSQAKTILTPEMVGGETMVHALMTTLGGVIRPITSDDLRQFRRTVGQLKAKVTKNAIRGGIRPKQAIQLSGKGDIERANKQIHTAVLAGGNKGVLRFITNAGPESKVSKHHVHVELGSWAAATASPRKPKELAKWVANEPLRFDCDCERHRYWFRYIATIGSWNYGRDEPGFPKIRNPKLQGVACKHVLRVMRELTGGVHIYNQIAKMIESGKSVVVKRADAEAMAKSQSRNIKTITPAKSARAAGLAIKLTKAGLTTKKPEAQRKATTKEAAQRAMDQQIAKFKAMGLKASDIKEMLSAMAAALK
jgi:DNA-binding transcriptional regulator YhcF (GntR family)/uncharacterized protein YdeI (BOF family)